MNAICRALELFCLFPAKILVRLLVFLEWKLTATNHSKAHHVFTCFRIDPRIGRFLWRRSLYGQIENQTEFDLQMTGSQEVLFCYERTIISLQFFINLIGRKHFRIQAMNTGSGHRKQPRGDIKMAFQNNEHGEILLLTPVTSESI